MRYPAGALATLFLLCPLVFGQDPPTPDRKTGALHDPARLPKPRLEAIRKAVKRTLKDNSIPGLSAAVVVDRRPAWAEGFGASDLENDVAATALTSYRLASVSKVVTATAVMQLVEKGKIDLDGDIRTYVPEFPEKKKGTVKVRHLLAHQSGVRHYKGRDDFSSTRPYDSLKAGLDRFKDDPLRYEPGTDYSYTTYGYSLLGRAVETTSGLSFMDYLRKNVFRPAGMETARDDSVHALIPHRAQGYVRARDGRLLNSNLSDTSYKIPGGGLCGSALDLAAFVCATLDSRLVKPETFQKMSVPQKTKDGRARRHGLGWTVYPSKERTLVGHGGAQQRVSTLVLMHPEQGSAVVLLCNLERMGGRLSALSREMMSLLE